MILQWLCEKVYINFKQNDIVILIKIDVTDEKSRHMIINGVVEDDSNGIW